MVIKSLPLFAGLSIFRTIYNGSTTSSTISVSEKEISTILQNLLSKFITFSTFFNKISMWIGSSSVSSNPIIILSCLKTFLLSVIPINFSNYVVLYNSTN